MATKAKTLPAGDDLTAFVVHVRENDLLLRGRDLADAPEGAGSWRYLIAALMDVAPREVTADMVATVKAADAAAREAAKAANPKAAKAPAKRRTTKAAPKAAPKAVAKAAAAPAADDLASVKADIAALTDAIGSILTMLGEK